MPPEFVDVLIVGAGLSGIGAAAHLQQKCPGKTYAILEGRGEIGGTWDLFRYPGLRSDSDMFTLGYSFRPWTEAKAIADGPSILRYVRDTARELGIEPHIRFNTRVVSARWSSSERRWLVIAESGPEKARRETSAAFLYICSGYYNYQAGYEPDFPGRADFKGTWIHPQKWPEGLDVSGKNVVVIGSGATAVTLVPALAKSAKHVTMLQRSPTYITTLPSSDVFANLLRKILPRGLAHKLVRAKNILIAMLFFQVCRRFPNFARRLIRAGVKKELPKGFPIDEHFKPSYAPWDQRVCFVPDADLFKAIKSGGASIATDRIRSLTPNGLALESGKSLEADVIVSATGLDLLALGGIQIFVDDREMKLGETFTYKGLMLSNVPNLAICVGYTNASWTLRADLSSSFVCRLLNQMDRGGYNVVEPKLDAGSMDAVPILDLASGYVERAVDRFPKQGTKAPWHLRQNYLLDFLTMKISGLDDGTLRFSK
jgi:monooxygenase